MAGNILKFLMGLIILLILVIGGLILFAAITLYRPAERTLVLTGDQPTLFSDTAQISIMTWNIGYAGMGDDMDFFYDGGKSMRTSRERTHENHKAILDFIGLNSHKDFILLQEVDKESKRSYRINSVDSLQQLMPEAWHAFGKNYDVRFVPVPFYAPMGKVKSGILTISHGAPIISERYSFPGYYPWPSRLFNLQRCFLLNRYPVDNGKELVVINTHNSAFDDGTLRKKQLDFLEKTLQKEYEKGNYVIAGGDWNMCPPEFEPDFYFNLFDTLDVMYIPKDFLPEWHWVYDANVPTNRRAKTPYDPASTLTTLIDFFVVSPNIKVLDVQGKHLDFKHSDHNPVMAKFQLLGDRVIKPKRYIER